MNFNARPTHLSYLDTKLPMVDWYPSRHAKAPRATRGRRFSCINKGVWYMLLWLVRCRNSKRTLRYSRNSPTTHTIPKRCYDTGY
ncbi:hypothetical protein HanIR_Chr12g0601741 [Helianthus annuus]|nr:hypothetical protein HanIR_Chr12g0601741 [Helianthus annuus]